MTPDSFSDGGKFNSTEAAVDRALRMEDEGADIVDIGGESTRPYAEPVAVDDELRRIVPVVERLVPRVGIPLSIDTTKAAVAKAAVELGAEIVNDISGLEADPEMLAVVANAKAGVCAMHMQGTPQTMQDSPEYEDVVSEIYDYLRLRDQALRSGGIEQERICLDPGIGFGKTYLHNLDLINAASSFLSLERPILVGHSRKGFIAKMLGDRSIDCIHGTLAVSLVLARQGIQILRVHDVAATKQAIQCLEALNQRNCDT